MVTNGQISLAATVTLVVPKGAQQNTRPGQDRFSSPAPSRYVVVKNLGPVTVFVGNAIVTPETGIPILTSGLIPFWLYPADELYGITEGNATIVSFLESGSIT